jgi:hypothetical protein
MKTDNPDITALIDDIRAHAQAIFKDRFGGMYLMGSLARGGFSAGVSDIDLGLILSDPLQDSDAETIAQLQSEVTNQHPKVQNSVSIFWGSIASINGQTNAGRYPPFDRLDLIDHALLLGGTDQRARLIRPSQQELEISNVKFALDYLGSDEVISEFLDCARITDKGGLYVSKTILYPTRFIYVARTGKIAGNDVSHDYYIDNFDGPEVDLVRFGYKLRQQDLPDDKSRVTQDLQQGLAILYGKFLDIYVARMAEYGQDALAARLLAWKQSITRP